MRVEKPWGYYEELYRDDDVVVKKLNIKKGGQLSLQRHKHRKESWTIIKGLGEFTLGSNDSVVVSGDTKVIHAGEKHRVKAHEPLVVIEVWTGSKLDEEDIERLSDAYDRI